MASPHATYDVILRYYNSRLSSKFIKMCLKNKGTSIKLGMF